jgi:hypothetical protein
MISVTPAATVTWRTFLSFLNSIPPLYTTAFDISEEEGGRVAEGVDAVEGEASRGTQRWIARTR